MKLTKQRIKRFKVTSHEVAPSSALSDLLDDIGFEIAHKKYNTKQFEAQVKEFGLDVALYDFIWVVAADLLNDIGVKQIKTSDKEHTPRKAKSKAKK